MIGHGRRRIAVSLALLAALVSAPALADAAAPARTGTSAGPTGTFDPTRPVDITAAEANLDQANRTLLLQGDVVAKQGPLELKADHVTVYYLASKDVGSEMGSKIQKMVAKGNVVVTRPGEIVRSQDATYDLPRNRILMSGNVVATRDGSIVKGQRVVVDLIKETIELQSTGTGGRVRALFDPPSKNGATP